MIINLCKRSGMPPSGMPRPRLFLCFALWLLSLFFPSCQSGSTSQSQDTPQEIQEDLQFQDYPNLKLGFTTQNFLQALPVSLANSQQLIDYAAEQGYLWIELRDPDAVLTLEESKEIAAYAQKKGVEVSYAIQKGLLDEDFWPTFERGIQNAVVMNGQKVIRSLASGKELTNDESRKGWTQEELAKLVHYADSAALIAKENGLQYVIENGAEAFFGENNQYYGMADLLSRVSDAVGWQFDTANPFSVSRVHASPDSIKSFLVEHIDNVHYIHLKSAKNGEAQPTLMDNPLALGEVLQLLSAHEVPYIAIELQAVNSLDQAYDNMQQSIHYLQSKQLIQNP